MSFECLQTEKIYLAPRDELNVALSNTDVHVVGASVPRSLVVMQFLSPSPSILEGKHKAVAGVRRRLLLSV